MQLTKQNKQVIVLYASSVVGMLIGMLNSVLNTRALTPEMYGDVRYVQNIISFVSSLLLFGFFVSGSRLLALSKDEQYSRRIRGILCTILGITIVVVMLTMTVLYFVSRAQGKDNLAWLFLLAIPCCGNVVLLSYVNTVSQGDNHIGRIALARLLPSTVYFFIAYFVFRAYGATPGKMLFIFNGSAVVILTAIILSTKPSFKALGTSFRLLREENKSYGFNVYLGTLAAVSTGYVSGITLGQFCDNNANVGFYTLALTLATPLTMLPSIIGTTYFKRFAEETKIDRKVMVRSVGLTALTCVVFILCIKYIVAWLYNDSYACVSRYAAWLAIGASLHGLGDMFNRFLGAHGQGKQLRNGAFVCGGVIIIGSTLLVYLFQVNGAIITKTVSDMVYLLMMVLYYLSFTQKNAS